MRRRRQRRDDAEFRAVARQHLFAAGLEAELHHLVDGAPRRAVSSLDGKAGFEKAQQRLDEERIVVGRAVPDLHRLPHRLGDALPGRIDDRAGRRARDEHAREVEHQRRVLVAARVQAGQRHDQFAAAEVRIADQVERGVGRQEAVAGERIQKVLAAGADDLVDFGGLGGCGRRGHGLRLRVAELDRVEQFGKRPADLGPIRVLLVARLCQRVADGGQPRPRRQVPECLPGATAAISAGLRSAVL